MKLSDKKVERVAIEKVNDNFDDRIGGVSKNSFDEVGRVDLDFFDMSSEGTVTSVEDVGELKRYSSDHIGGVESNSSDIIGRVVLEALRTGQRRYF
jgi:hypothetical protein